MLSCVHLAAPARSSSFNIWHFHRLLAAAQRGSRMRLRSHAIHLFDASHRRTNVLKRAQTLAWQPRCLYTCETFIFKNEQLEFSRGL